MISRETVDTATRAMDYAAGEEQITEAANEAAFVELNLAWGRTQAIGRNLRLLEELKPGDVVRVDDWIAAGSSDVEYSQSAYNGKGYFKWPSGACLGLADAMPVLIAAIRGGAAVIPSDVDGGGR